MTVQDLIDELQGINPESEVRLAEQPNWPFEYELKAIAEVEDIVYLGEGTQLGYLPGEVA